MTLEEELRIYDLTINDEVRHGGSDGLQAIDMMRNDIMERYFGRFKESGDRLRAFNRAYLQYQLDLYQCQCENLGDESFVRGYN